MKNIEITAIILGICPQFRLDWLKQNVDYLDSQNFPFVKKIIAIDEFNGNKISSELVDYFKSKGWIVLVDNHRSRVLSMEHAFSLVESEYIFYNEDDVLSTMPNIDDLTSVFNTEINNRKCGMISMTLGGTQFDPSINDEDHKFIGDLKHMDRNTILKNENYNIFRRMEEYSNAWFFEFPGLFIRTGLFKKCHEGAKKAGGQIEQALTLSYRNYGYINEYYKCSIAKINSLELLKQNPMCVNSDCRLLTNLDANQGNGSHSGNNFY